MIILKFLASKGLITQTGNAFREKDLDYFFTNYLVMYIFYFVCINMYAFIFTELMTFVEM